jgi:hypothetical protein
MSDYSLGVDEAGDSASLERRVNRLATERSALFDRAGAHSGLSNAQQERLRSIERELDECFLARRRMRAVCDARRFDPYARLPHRPGRRGISS